MGIGIRTRSQMLLMFTILPSAAFGSLIGDTVEGHVSEHPHIVGGFENANAIVSASEIEFEGTLSFPNSGSSWRIYADIYKNTITIGFSDPRSFGQPQTGGIGLATNVPFEFLFTDLQLTGGKEIQGIRLLTSSPYRTPLFIGPYISTWYDDPSTWDFYTTRDSIFIGGIEGFSLHADGAFATFQIIVPEPSTWCLLVGGLAGIALRARGRATK